MSVPSPDPTDCASAPPADQPDGEAAPTAAAGTVQRSRIGTVLVGGFFDPAVPLALKTLALREGTTVQALVAHALNDLLERAGLGRPASEAMPPRGGAAHRRRDRSKRP